MFASEVVIVFQMRDLLQYHFGFKVSNMTSLGGEQFAVHYKKLGVIVTAKNCRFPVIVDKNDRKTTGGPRVIVDKSFLMTVICIITIHFRLG